MCSGGLVSRALPIAVRQHDIFVCHIQKTGKEAYAVSHRQKNYMFCGNHDAAEETTIMYTMMMLQAGWRGLPYMDFHFLTHIHARRGDLTTDYYIHGLSLSDPHTLGRQ